MTEAGARLIGLGNAIRGDDAVGLLVARRARQIAGDDVEVLELEGEPLDLIGAWESAGAVVVVDAVRSGAQPGTIVTHDVLASPLPAGLAAASTHALGLAEAVELARSLGRLPERLVIVGVEAADLTPGAPPTAPVAAAVGAAAAQALATLSAPSGLPETTR